eukprot:jgi/Astpho2/8306/e_gw1.00122.31.1_t
MSCLTVLSGCHRFLHWVLSFAVPGLGMFNEAYYIFSVGNVKPIWAAQYPACVDDYQEGCSETFIHTLNYTQVTGLFAGMVSLGFAIDRIGRKIGSIFTALVMIVGGILLTVSTGPNARSLFLMLIIAQTIFGFGVGGEFPVAASSASERAEGSTKLQKLRGQTVVLVFSMQAWGNLLNLAVLLFFMAVLGQYGPTYNPTRLSIVWRLQYGLGLIPICYMVYHRIFKLKESEVWKASQSCQQPAGPKPGPWRGLSTSQRLRLLLRHYGFRLLGTCLGWAFMDAFYYGNKLFQTEFIQILTPGASVVKVLEYNFLNSSVALFGYYFAAFTVDKPWMGRRRMQLMGFGFIFVIFLIGGAAFNRLTATKTNLSWFQFIYYLSSFFVQFGPNATTFLLAGEVFPTEARGLAHGISAAVGKLGALTADIVLSQISDQNKFYFGAGAAGLGALVTILFIPEISELDLREGDVRWEAIKHGEQSFYGGEAVAPRYLSWVEQVTGVGKQRPAPAR